MAGAYLFITGSFKYLSSRDLTLELLGRGVSLLIVSPSFQLAHISRIVSILFEE
jgi:hypothetical protein